MLLSQMHSPVCAKSELHLDDRILDRILITWSKWWKLARAVLRLAVRRRHFAELGAYLKLVKARREAEKVDIEKYDRSTEPSKSWKEEET